LIGVPAVAHAQEATVSGTMTDSIDGVLPGVTVTAVHEASGNTIVGVTDDRGMFRSPFPPSPKPPTPSPFPLINFPVPSGTNPALTMFG